MKIFPYLKFILFIGFILILYSCYSVRISNVKGAPEPDPMNFQDGYYRGKAVKVIDTTVNIGALENQVMMIETCPTGSFQTFEYRVSLGQVLLGGITLGKVRKIKAKYICLKESN
jgi:hypothetical protein